MHQKSILLVFFLLVVSSLCSQECEDLKKIKVQRFLDSSQNFSEVNPTPEELKTAFKIVVSKKSIPILCENFLQGLKYVETVIFEDNDIGEMQAGAFKDLPGLSNLVMVGNRIKKIPEGVFDGLNMRKLNLSGNEIEKIHPKAFEKTLRLEVLDLSKNKLKKIERSWFEKLVKLSWVILDDNLLEEIPEGAFKFDTTHHAKIDIWLMGNKIEKIGKEAFGNIQIINTLMLNENQISVFPKDAFYNLGEVKEIFLNDNKIVCLSKKELLGMEIVKSLNFGTNPLECGCLRDIKEWGKRKNVEIHAASRSVECAIELIAYLKKESNF